MEYTVDYFIKKFSNTRDDKWCTGIYQDYLGNACAIGWCGITNRNEENNEGFALCSIFDINGLSVSSINDGIDINYQQSTPKQRILAALYDIKKLTQPKYPDITKQIASLPIQNDVPDLKLKLQK